MSLLHTLPYGGCTVKNGMTLTVERELHFVPIESQFLLHI